MEISPFTVYLWQQADSFINLFVGASIALGFLAAGILLFNYLEYGSDEPLPKKFSVLVVAAFIFAGLGALTPSTKTIAMMYAVPAIVNSKPVQQDLPELYQMGVEALKAQLAPKPPAKLETPAKQ